MRTLTYPLPIRVWERHPEGGWTSRPYTQMDVFSAIAGGGRPNPMMDGGYGFAVECFNTKQELEAV